MKIEVTEEMRERVALYGIEKTNERCAGSVRESETFRMRAAVHADTVARLVAAAIQQAQREVGA